MYIRRTHTNNSATGERYFTYRLVANQRIGGKPRQTTLLNLGRHFAIDQDQWPGLCARIDELVGHQSPLFPMDLASSVELLAAVKKRGKLADIDDGKRPSILINKKGPIKALFAVIANGYQNGCPFSLQMFVSSKSANGSIPRWVTVRIRVKMGNSDHDHARKTNSL
jgi:hypothetical protein